MMDEQAAELSKLAEAKGRAEEALRCFGYVNVFGRSQVELDDIARQAARLEAEVVEATARYRAFMSRLSSDTEDAARAHYARIGGGER